MLDDEILGNEDDDNTSGAENSTPTTNNTEPTSNEPTVGSDSDVLTSNTSGDLAMSFDEAQNILRDNHIQTGVMNPVSNEDKERLGEYASVTYRGNRKNDFLDYQVKKQDVAAKHTKLYSYGF